MVRKLAAATLGVMLGLWFVSLLALVLLDVSKPRAELPRPISQCKIVGPDCRLGQGVPQCVSSAVCQ